MEKVGRNDPCPCGSGKKFKKCCEKKMIGKKFVASKLETTPLKDRITQAGGLTSLFKNKVTSVISGERKKEVDDDKIEVKEEKKEESVEDANEINPTPKDVETDNTKDLEEDISEENKE
jgi:hypothetical protein